MSGMVAWFARNAVAANLLMVVAFIGGVLGFNQMEREMFPVVPVAGASVTMTWQGASPQDVEEQIITRIEEAVADIDGLERITSIARESFAVVNIRGRDDIDMQVFIDEIKLRVDQINNLPQAAFQPQVTRWEQRDWYFGMAVYGDVDPITLKRVADGVRDDIAEISGGELAVLQGVLDEEVSIEISEDQLRRYNLSFSEVTAYAAPRRLALVINNLETQAPNAELVAWGPPVAVAFDAEGQPTRAAEAFAKKIIIQKLSKI